MRLRAVVTLMLLCSCGLAWAGDDASRLNTLSGACNVFGLVDHGDKMVGAYSTPPGEIPKRIVNGNAMRLYGNRRGQERKHVQASARRSPCCLAKTPCIGSVKA